MRGDPVPHHLRLTRAFAVRVFDHLSRFQIAALMSHAEAAGTDIHQPPVNGERLRIIESDHDGALRRPAYFFTLLGASLTAGLLCRMRRSLVHNAALVK